MLPALTNTFGNDAAMTAIEYALIAGLIALAIFSVVVTLGISVNNSFSSLTSGL
jgi:Flp pilus assembly pilin Flp